MQAGPEARGTGRNLAGGEQGPVPQQVDPGMFGRPATGCPAELLAQNREALFAGPGDKDRYLLAGPGRDSLTVPLHLVSR
jgi:hypothetical protein